MTIEPPRRRATVRLTFGLDLAKFSDYAALALIEQRAVEIDTAADLENPQPGHPFWDYTTPPILHLTGLRRWPIGTEYHAVVSDVAAIVARLAQRREEPHRLPPDRVILCMDATGVGAPVAELFRRHEEIAPRLVEAVITGGEEASAVNHGYRVPKRDLVAGLQVALASERLKFAMLPETVNLLSELKNFQAKITAAGNLTYSAPPGQHDDLLMAAALAVWHANRTAGPDDTDDLRLFGKIGRRDTPRATVEYANLSYGPYRERFG